MIYRKPVLGEDYVIEFQLDNKAQEAEFNVEKTELSLLLREELRNFKIMLQFSVTAIDAKNKKPYTATEKFKFLAEKNAAIIYLKQLFDLDLEI